MENNNKFLSILSLCQRAGRLSSGELACEVSIKERNAHLIIIAEDATENTKKKFSNSSKFYNIEIITMFSKAQLGWAIGKDYRAVITINDEGFKNKLLGLIDDI